MADALLRVALVDDHPSVLRGVGDVLASHFGQDIEIVACSCVLEVESTGRDFDAVVLDLQLNDGTDPADNVGRLRDRGWPVLLYTQESNPVAIARCLQQGAGGIVGKHEPLDVLAVALSRVRAGEQHLSHAWAAALEDGANAPDLAPREVEALRLYASGLPLKSVAARMEISAETVREYLKRVNAKYAQAGRPAAGKTDLFVRAIEDGHLPSPGSTFIPR